MEENHKTNLSEQLHNVVTRILLSDDFDEAQKFQIISEMLGILKGAENVPLVS